MRQPRNLVVPRTPWSICWILILSVCAIDVVAEDTSPRAVADGLIAKAGIPGGLVVHIGCGDGQLTAALCADERFLVHGLDVDAQRIQQARDTLHRLGAYGPVSVAAFDGSRLPYADGLVTLVVVQNRFELTEDELHRVLAPGGVLLVQQAGTWQSDRRTWPEDIDQWTHYLHGPDNNAVAADRVANEPRSIQWITEPRFGRSHEELASMSTAVTAEGRLFFIVDEAPFASVRYDGQWRLVARDAFNGLLLWKREIPRWIDHLRHFRSGPVHLQRRLVAVGDRVYATLGLGAPVTALSATTGETLRTYSGTEHTEEILLQDGILYLVVGTSEIERIGGGLSRRKEPEPTDFRSIMAVDADSGRMLWRHRFGEGEFLLPLTLAVGDDAVYYQSTRGVGKLDAGSGEPVWQTPRSTLARRMAFSAPTLVVTDEVVLCADREPSSKAPEQTATENGQVTWGVHGWNEAGFSRKGASRLRAYSAKSGKELWDVACSEQYNSPTDVFVVDQVVWVGSNFRGYDLVSGELIRELPWKGAPVSMPHHRCYRNKATEDLIFTGRSGIEVVSLQDGWVGNNSWVRGTCQYGILPANGLVYAPPNACACNNKVKVLGFFAAAPAAASATELTADSARLQKGPAYSDENAEPSPSANADESWPMYRRDAARSGSVATTVPESLVPRWSVALSGRLTQPIAVDHRVYVTSTDTHAVHALDADNGKTLWSYTAGARIDSAPTYYRGRILFGSADGWVYCLRAEDGALAWRFQAAPRERLVCAFDQLESTWPVHGSVLIQNDVLTVTAGRNTYLDGGLSLIRLDPLTGESLSHTTVCHLDPESGRQTGAETSRGFDMEGVRSDLLTGDGERVFMKHFCFDRDGQQIDQSLPHLLSVDGFLGEEWFVRSYWIYGPTVSAGWGGWASASNQWPTGRILAFDGSDLYGYGRAEIASGPVGHRADAYQLWRGTTPSAERQATGKPARGAAKRSKPECAWSDAESLIVRAMALTTDKLLVAGPPDLGQKREDVLAFGNPEEALAAFQGEHGVFLRLTDLNDGATLAEYSLPAVPVFDGMSAAHGRVFVALQDGTVQCWAPE